MLFIYVKCRQSFKRQPHEMVKNTQTIRRQQPTNWLCLAIYRFGTYRVNYNNPYDTEEEYIICWRFRKIFLKI